MVAVKHKLGTTVAVSYDKGRQKAWILAPGALPRLSSLNLPVSTIVRQKKRSEGYLLVLLVHGFLVLWESRRSLSVEPVQLKTLWTKVICTGMKGVEIMTRVPRRHGNRMVNERYSA